MRIREPPAGHQQHPHLNLLNNWMQDSNFRHHFRILATKGNMSSLTLYNRTWSICWLLYTHIWMILKDLFVKSSHIVSSSVADTLEWKKSQTTTWDVYKPFKKK